MSRNPRAGASAIGLTKTEQLRRAKTAAMVQELEKKREALVKHQAEPATPARRKKILSYEPKKVDFSKPTMTKSMMARLKHAEKFKQEYESKKEITTGDRRPKRTPAPIGGDARVGRERVPKETRPPRPITPPPRPITPTPPSPRPGPSRLPAPRGGFGFGAGPSQLPTFRRTLKPPEQGPSIARKTNELARMMNADIIQAEPIGDGPISNIVIPPGTVNDDRTTIVSIPQPAVDSEARLLTSQVANRSIQVISETLDEQDASESATVQNKLTELQQARREFVIAVANVGGNAVGIDEPAQPALPPKTPTARTPVRSPARSPARSPPRQVYRPGPLEPVFGHDHPDILAAREHIQRTLANIEARKAQQRRDDEFERIGAMDDSDDLRLDVPFEEELYQARDISWEEDDEGIAMPIPSRVKAYVEPIPKQQRPYDYQSFDPENLEKFFDVERFPPCPICGPPEGREQLHPDLWELDDPWFKYPPMPDDPDLIEFDLIDFDA